MARHHLLALQDEQRVAQGEQLEALLHRAHLGRVGVEVGGEPGLGLDEVEPAQEREVAQAALGALPHRLGQLAQDARLLLGGHGGRDGELVAALHHRVGLDEEGLPGLRRVVHDAGDRGAGAGQHRHHVAVVADGEVGVAQVALHQLVGEQRLHLRLEGAVQPADAVAQGGQLGAGPVGDGAARLDGALDAIGQPLVGGEPGGDGPQAGRPLEPRLQEAAGAHGRAQQGRALAQGGRLQRAPLGGARHLLLGGAGEGEREGEPRLGQRPGLLDGEERLPHLGGAGQEGERAGLLAPGREPAALRQGLHHLGPAEVDEAGVGLGVHALRYTRPPPAVQVPRARHTPRPCYTLGVRRRSQARPAKGPAVRTPRQARPARRPAVESGLDRLVAERFRPLRGLTVGLVCNPTAVDARLRHAADLLAAAPGVRLGALFGPEHGVRGDIPYMAAVADARDERTGVPVHSLYGSSAASLSPRAEQLRGLDALVFDIQDVGARYYTYQATMMLCMEAAAGAGLRFVVLDRPDPIGGAQVEGPRSAPASRASAACTTSPCATA